MGDLASGVSARTGRTIDEPGGPGERHIGPQPGVQAHRRELFGIAYRILGTASDAEDIVQDAYLRYRRTLDDGVAIVSPRPASQAQALPTWSSPPPTAPEKVALLAGHRSRTTAADLSTLWSRLPEGATPAESPASVPGMTLNRVDAV